MNINIKDGLPFILWDSMIGNKRKIFLTVLFLILIAGILSTIIFRVYRNHRAAKVFNELNNYIEYGSPGLHLTNDETLTVANEITNMIMDYNTVKVLKINAPKTREIYEKFLSVDKNMLYLDDVECMANICVVYDDIINLDSKMAEPEIAWSDMDFDYVSYFSEREMGTVICSP